MKTIVVLGTGVAAAAVIRQTMKSTVLKRSDIKMVVVSPNTHFFWPIAMPRAVVPGQFADDKFMFALEPTFAEYPADKFEFVLGAAAALDPDAKTVTVALGNGEGSRRAIAYDTLVIATGASSRDGMPWKPLDDTATTVGRLHDLQRRIKDAKTIVVAGGGTTGVETVGELGYEYARNGSKKIYYVHSDALPLSDSAIASVRKQTRAEIAKLGVKIIPHTKVTKVTASGADTVLELTAADGTKSTLTAQAYLPALGLTPNTGFVPARMLDAAGYVRQTTTLQAEEHDDIFVLGDAGSLEGNKASAADAQARHLIAALPLRLDGGDKKATLPEYKPASKDMFGVTLGRKSGTGQMGSFKIFSILIWYLKGRFLGTDYADHVAAGKRTLTTKFE
ncbi:hypothetical protein PWT90_00672 [Aphanocladium album]|nr:hypothetical protein PWT90_00672 [Aphanocladium album]